MRSISPSVRGATRLNRRRLESSRTTVNSPLPRLFASSIRLFPRFLAPSRLGGKGYLADVGMRCSASVRVDLLIGADDLTCPLLRLVFSAHVLCVIDQIQPPRQPRRPDRSEEGGEG